jgi:DNA repair protein RadC
MKSPENLHAGHRQRLRSRFLEEGLDGFHDHQVLELLLFHVIPRGDTNPVAHRLMERFGSLSAVLEADPRDLETVEGMGSRASAFLSLVPPLTRRYFHDRVLRDRPLLNCATAVSEYLVPLMAGRPEEVFYLLCLDSRCRVIHPVLLSEGTVRETAVYPRHVVQEAIRHRATAVILAHNHPAGSVAPSQQDRHLTRLLVQALGPLDIRVLDHIIVGGDRTFSFAGEGELPAYEGRS